MKRAPSRAITTVLFDLGGVLADDIFEHVLFDRRFGLAPRSWSARRRWRSAARELWDRYAVMPRAGEPAFWRDFAAAVGSPLSASSTDPSERRSLRINPRAAAVIRDLDAAGLRIGLVSDNTAFWYPQQLAALKLEPDPKLCFLSFQHGRTKATGLFNVAAASVDPHSTLVVEDRPSLRRAARAAGFRVAGYNLASRRSLAAALRRHGVTPLRPDL